MYLSIYMSLLYSDLFWEDENHKKRVQKRLAAGRDWPSHTLYDRASLWPYDTVV